MFPHDDSISTPHGPLAQQEEQLTLNQQVQGSSPWRLILDTKPSLTSPYEHSKERLIDKTSQNCHRLDTTEVVGCQYTATLSDALAVYEVCARAEGKNPKTVRAVAQAVSCFNDFLGEIDVEEVTSNHLRQITYSDQPEYQSDGLLVVVIAKPRLRLLCYVSLSSCRAIIFACGREYRP